MVTVVNYETKKNSDGEEFNVLILQGEIEMIQSKQTGKYYATAKTCSISCTFDELMCQNLIGKHLPGSIEKIEVDPYEYKIPNSEETITLTYTYFYDPHPKHVENEVLGRKVQPN